jgi:hypothetical protein
MLIAAGGKIKLTLSSPVGTKPIAYFSSENSDYFLKQR